MRFLFHKLNKHVTSIFAGMAEQADAGDLKSPIRLDVRVQIPLPALVLQIKQHDTISFRKCPLQVLALLLVM